MEDNEIQKWTEWFDDNDDVGMKANSKDFLKSPDKYKYLEKYRDDIRNIPNAPAIPKVPSLDKTIDELKEDYKSFEEIPKAHARTMAKEAKVSVEELRNAWEDKTRKDIRLRHAGVTDKTTTRIVMPELDEDKTKDFKFNWLAAYKGSTGKTLYNTPEDVKTLDNWILGQMGKIEKEPLEKVARELKIYNPDNETWDDFLSSPNGQEFKKMLADTRSYKQQKDLEQIWDDNSLASGVVNYMLPVTKEYAKRNYQDISGWKDIAVPFAVDVASQVAMTGKPSAGLKAGLPKLVIENTAAPVITESGQVALNDKDIASALSDAGSAVATNFGTPAALQGIGSRVAGIGRKAGLSPRGIKEQQFINTEVNKAAKTQRRLEQGTPYVGNELSLKEMIELPEERTLHWKEGEPILRDSRTDVPLTEKEQITAGSDVVSKNDYKQYKNAKDFMRKAKLSKMNVFLKDIDDQSRRGYDVLGDKLANNPVTKAKKKLSEAQLNNDFSKMTPKDWWLLNKVDKETVTNYFGRKISDLMEDNPSLANYLTNMAGKPQFGQRATRPILSILPFVDTEYGKNDKEDEMKSKVFTRDYLLGGRK